MHSKHISEIIDSALNKPYNLTSSDTNIFCQEVSGIYTKTAQLSLKMKRKIYRRKHKYTLQEEMNYMQLKRELDGVAKSFQKNPCNSFLRGKFFYLKRNFRRILKSTQKRHKQNMLHQIQSLQHNNPQAFWKLYNSLKNKDNKAGDFDPEVFHDYFKSLHGVSSNKHFDKEFQERLEKKLKNIQKKTGSKSLISVWMQLSLKVQFKVPSPKKLVVLMQ